MGQSKMESFEKIHRWTFEIIGFKDILEDFYVKIRTIFISQSFQKILYQEKLAQSVKR